MTPTPEQARAALPVLREAMARDQAGKPWLTPLRPLRIGRRRADNLILRLYYAAREDVRSRIHDAGNCPLGCCTDDDAMSLASFVAAIRECKRIAGERR